MLQNDCYACATKNYGDQSVRMQISQASLDSTGLLSSLQAIWIFSSLSTHCTMTSTKSRALLAQHARFTIAHKIQRYNADSAQSCCDLTVCAAITTHKASCCYAWQSSRMCDPVLRVVQINMRSLVTYVIAYLNRTVCEYSVSMVVMTLLVCWG